MEKLNIHEIPKDIYLIKNIPLVLHDMKTVHQLCTQKYYNHSKGCPNFNKKDGCPPHIQHISQQYDLESMNMLLLRFPFYYYITLKQQEHPDWSLRELSNQRHWQNHLKGTLNEYWKNIKNEYPEYKLIKNPEAQGVNVEETLSNIDIPLNWCKQDEYENITQVPEYMYHVYLMGKELDNQTT